MRKPVVITARGSDINLLPRYRLPRMMIRYAAQQAAGVMANSRALKDALVALGAPAAKVRVLRNGVDLAMFRPLNRSEARAHFDVSSPTLLSVGNLVELKGHDLVIGALPALPQYSLLIVGDGPQRNRLQQLAATLGVTGRVKFLGRIAHDQLAAVYSAADALVLASSHEGWPNVLLEAMACGTPVIASNIGGNPEVVAAPEAGSLIQDRTSLGIVSAVNKLAGSPIDRVATRRYAEKFSWDATTDGQIRLYSEILNGSGNSLVCRNEPR
jgi:glycosyltransferase involved in cell wall biosynthesis